MKPIALVTALVLLLGGCDPRSVVSLRLDLREDASGRLRASTLEIPTDGDRLEAVLSGAEVDVRARLACVSGTFADVGALRLSDLSFRPLRREGETALSGLEVILPRGPEAAWTRTFAPADPEARARVARTVDPEGRIEEIGSTVRFEVVLPRPPIVAGARPGGTAVAATVNGSTAALVVDLEFARQTGPDIVWRLGW